MRPRTLILLGFLALAPGLPAQDLPDMPVPKDSRPIAPLARPMPREFWDRPNKIAAVAMIGLTTADVAQTCHGLITHTAYEIVLTQSCGKNVAIVAGSDAAAIFGAWFLHRTGHHRLERVPMVFMGYQSAYGLIYSKHTGAW